jgi:hypothetical protein
MISLGSKPLIVVNPVMVVLFMRREMVTHLPARFEKLVMLFLELAQVGNGEEQSSEWIR